MRVDPYEPDMTHEEHETNKSNWCYWFHFFVLTEAVSVLHWITMFTFPDFCEDMVAATVLIVFNYSLRNSDYRFVWQLLYLSGAAFILSACCQLIYFSTLIFLSFTNKN